MPCIRHGAGLLFCPAAIQPHTSVYSAFCAVYAIIPPTPQNSAQNFTVAFPVICPIIPPQIPNQHNKPLHNLRYAGAHHSAAMPPAHTRYQRHAGRCTDQHSRPIIIRYIRAQQIADHASPAGSAPTVCGSLASATPGAPAEGCSVSACTGSARRHAIWHRVSSGTLYPASQSSSRARRAARNH